MIVTIYITIHYIVGHYNNTINCNTLHSRHTSNAIHYSITQWYTIVTQYSGHENAQQNFLRDQTIFLVINRTFSIIQIFMIREIQMAYSHPLSPSCGGLEGPFGPCLSSNIQKYTYNICRSKQLKFQISARQLFKRLRYEHVVGLGKCSDLAGG